VLELRLVSVAPDGAVSGGWALLAAERSDKCVNRKTRTVI
jgi:hypothetical protein